jgi:hypothetical protein
MKVGLCYCIAVSLLLFIPSSLVSSVVYTGEPKGFVVVNITAGTGSSRKVSLISVPLLGELRINGARQGTISSLTPQSLSFDHGGWTPGELSNLNSPHGIVMTSGVEAGRFFLISSIIANTSNIIYFDSSDLLRHGGVTNLSLSVGDSFKIIPLETLSSFFGTPESTLIKGGTSASQADIVTLINNGSAFSYYFNTTLGRWSRVSLGNQDATHVPLLPHYGIQYSRLANTPLQFLVMGNVPQGQRFVPVKNSGSTLLSSYWTSERSLSAFPINTLDTWKVGATSSVADTLTISQGGSISTFFFDGANWRKISLGLPLSNGFNIPLGASVLISKKGGQDGFTDLSDPSPY